MKEIPLSQNKVTIVDDEDYEFLNQWKWYAIRDHNNYYAARSIHVKDKCHQVRIHKVLMNPLNGYEVDHKNRDGLDNRKSNLRVCLHSENGRNRRPWGKSKYLGVSYWNRSLVANIQVNRKNIRLGSYRSEEEAAKAYDEAAKKYHGEFANLNFK